MRGLPDRRGKNSICQPGFGKGHDFSRRGVLWAVDLVFMQLPTDRNTQAIYKGKVFIYGGETCSPESRPPTRRRPRCYRLRP